ncbi:MAG: adenylate/guanylate cyclase domain-containing protein [Syntrophales bacterium]
MTAQELKRKLTAILNADVKGYSRLMGEDEEGTVRTLNAYKEVMSGLVQKYRGRVVDSPGDNVLAEFISVVDAVKCAVEIQTELKTRNAELPENRRMEFRIGVNLGDVIEEGERIFGDGLNIAARLESLSEAGGICISGTAFDQVENKLSLGYEYLGEQTVKNIAKPVRVYRVLPVAKTASWVSNWKRIGFNYWKRVDPVIKIIVALIIAANAVWQFYTRFINPSFDVTPKDKIAEVASVGKMALPLPDKPSIAVLPFTNMSNDPKQEYFSDGLTEEIITALSKVPKLFVIARNSTFTYKGKPVKVQQVSQELGVRYVLEGSVRKDGNNIRITAQLIDALTGNHLWAESYDRNLSGIFAVQGEITKKIITSMQVHLTEGEQAQAYARGTNNLEAYLKMLQGRELTDRVNPERNALARQLAEEAIALDPRYAGAYGLLAATHLNDSWFGFSKSPKDSLEKSIELLQKAIILDDTYALAHAVLGYVFSFTGQHDKAVAEGEKAIALNPNSADSHMFFGKILTIAGKYEESIAELKTAIRLNPIPPNIYLFSLGMSYALTGQYDEAITWCEKAVRQEPNSWSAHIFMAAIYGDAGHDKEARIEAAEVLRINPKYSLEKHAKSMTFKNQEDRERAFIAPLRKAGLK